jgi:transposase
VKKAPGRPRHLTPTREKTLRVRLKEPPWKRYPRDEVGDVWTVELAFKELNKVSSVSYTEETALKVIRKLGFRLKRRRRSPDGTIVPAHWVVHYAPKARRKGRRTTPPWGY